MIISIAIYSVVGLIIAHLYMRAYPSDASSTLDAIDEHFNISVSNLFAQTSVVLKAAAINFKAAMDDLHYGEIWQKLNELRD